MSSIEARDFNSFPAPNHNDQLAAQQASQALDLLRKEERQHQDQVDQTGLIGRAVAGLTEFWHQSSSTGSQVDDLRVKIQADIAAGKTGDAAALAGGAKSVVAADQVALKERGEASQIGSGVVQAAGLFMAGRRGLFVAGAAAALDAIKPGSKDSFGEQAADVGLGVARALTLKAGYWGAGKLNLGLATTAVGLGFGSRLTDLTLNRQTYLDVPTGHYSAKLGAEKIWQGTTDKGALASDIVGLILARGALGKLNSATDGALTSNKLFSTMAVGGVFGMSQGAASEMIRQGRTGAFEPGQFVSRALVSGLTSMAGAALGRGGSMHLAEGETPLQPAMPKPETALSESLTAGGRALDISGARPNFSGSTSRQYQLVGSNMDVADLLGKSTGAPVMARVREIAADGSLLPEQNLLVAHAKDGKPIDPVLAAKADAVASCTPGLLPLLLRAKHIMPSVQDALFLTQKPGGRLSFTQNLSEALMPGQSQPVALGNRSVSEMLLDPRTLEKIYSQPNPHNLGLYSRALRDFKIPAKQVLVGGADNLVFELADDSILKITHKEWNPEWGFRTYRDPQGHEHVFDARIIGKPQPFDSPEGQATYFIQERAIKTPVDPSTVPIFAHRLDYDGKYSFWDRDATQLGVVLRNGQRVVKLLDYDAVRTLDLVPKDLKTPHENRFDNDDDDERFGWHRTGRR